MKFEEVINAIKPLNSNEDDSIAPIHVRQKWVAVDFDGVIHRYREGWKNGEIYDGVCEGAIEAIDELRSKGYYVAIHTARIVDSISLTGLKINDERLIALQKWLADNKVPYDAIIPKMVALAYIDDRAVKVEPEAGHPWKDVVENMFFTKLI